MIRSRGIGAATAAGNVLSVTGTGFPTDDCRGVPGPVITGGCDGVCGVVKMVGLYAGKDGGVSFPCRGSTILWLNGV